MKTLQILTLLFLILTPIVCAFNAWWCWCNRYCNGESEIVKMKSRLWISIAVTLILWVSAGIIDPDHRVRKTPAIICSFSGATVLFFASCRFLAFHISGGRTLHPDDSK